jgi:transposase, IS5 family
MWQRERKQMSLADAVVARREGQNARLERIGGLLDWERIEQMLGAVYAAGEGRPAYRPLVMVRVLLLQQWYSLSDPEMEEALCDRLSFRRFVGLSLEQEVPDHSTLSRFRTQMVQRGLSAQLFSEVNRQLDERGLMLKRGTIIDASLVAASVKPPRDAQSTPGQGTELDPEADWTQRKGGGGSHFGYKAHVAVDQGSGLIRKTLLTSAKVNDGEVADQLICGDEQMVYADKAYDSKSRRELLARMGIGDGIMRRARWGTAHRPDPALVARNLSLSTIRSAVERSFGAMKQWYGYRRVRYRGLARNALQLHLMCIAINLRRALVLDPA